MGRVVWFEVFIKFLCLVAFYKGAVTLLTGDSGRYLIMLNEIHYISSR